MKTKLFIIVLLSLFMLTCSKKLTPPPAVPDKPDTEALNKAIEEAKKNNPCDCSTVEKAYEAKLSELSEYNNKLENSMQEYVNRYNELQAKYDKLAQEKSKVKNVYINVDNSKDKSKDNSKDKSTDKTDIQQDVDTAGTVSIQTKNKDKEKVDIDNSNKDKTVISKRFRLAGITFLFIIVIISIILYYIYRNKQKKKLV